MTLLLASFAFSFAIASPPPEHSRARDQRTVCIAPFRTTASPSDAQLTNAHQPGPKSHFVFLFGKQQRVESAPGERQEIKLRRGTYRVKVLLDGTQVESFRLRVSESVSLWYLPGSGWQVSSYPDRAHGCPGTAPPH
jgi:hypothetical protein